MRQTSFNRADTVPATPGYYERAYPNVAGHPHPLPIDYWNGKEWLAVVPDNRSPYKIKATGLGLQTAHKAGNQALGWRKMPGIGKITPIGTEK